MKAVLISIQPKWVEKIASGEKTIEVRKSIPKLERPFKVYIYATNGTQLVDVRKEKIYLDVNKPFLLTNGKSNKVTCSTPPQVNRKVIGEFVCDKITDISVVVRNCNENYNEVYHNDECKGSCLTWKELQEYGKGKTLYGWHISDLKLYDKPKALSEFYPIKPKRVEKWVNKDDCAFCKYHRWGKNFTETCLLDKPEPICEYTPPLERPPQSWCYVESLGE